MCLAVAVTRGHPCFDIEFLDLSQAKVASADVDHAVGQAKGTHYVFGIGEDFLVVFDAGLFVVGADYHLLDLVEIVDAVEAEGVLAGRTSFAAEARRYGNIFFRQLGFFENLFAMECRQRYLRRADQAHPVSLAQVGVIPAEGEITRAVHYRFIHQHRQRQQLVALSHHLVNRQAEYCLMEHSACTFECKVATACQLDSAWDVDNVQCLAEFDVVFRLEVELPYLAFDSQLDVFRIIGTDGYFRPGRLGNQEHHIVELRFQFADEVVELFRLGLDLGHPFDGGLFLRPG